jgi:hypothetical protein
MIELPTIATDRPSAARMYDYFLGGQHNFEVDRQAAAHVLSLLPFIPTVARLQRMCLKDIAEKLTRQDGVDVIIDFASGLPTQEHLHNIVAPGTTVIYADNDPEVVSHAHALLQDTPNVYYFQNDARRPQDLLNHPEVAQILDGRRDIALIYWGICWTFNDEEIATIAHMLHDWSGGRSCWVVDIPLADADPNDPAMARVIDIYNQLGSPMYVRSLQAYRHLVQPWQPDARGFVSFLDWHNLDQSIMNPADQQSLGQSGGGYGAYLIKP